MNDVLVRNQLEIEIPPEQWVNLNDAWSRFEKEAAIGSCPTSRYELPYFAWGEGPPLIFIHGLADDMLSFVLPVSILSRHFCCIAYDLPRGTSDKAKLGRYRHADFTDDLFQLMDHLNIDRSYIYGSSFGSTITLSALHKQPERFERAVLQGGFAKRPLALGEIFLCSLARYWKGPMKNLPFREQCLRVAHFDCFAPREEDVWNYYLERACSTPMSSVARMALILHQVDLRAKLSAIKQPVLMICGDRDHLVGKDCEETLLEGLPNVSRVEFARCGHLPYFTHPELTAEVIQRFCKPPLPCQI